MILEMPALGASALGCRAEDSQQDPFGKVAPLGQQTDVHPIRRRSTTPRWPLLLGLPGTRKFLNRTLKPLGPDLS